MQNTFQRLYLQRLTTANKPFLARGVTVKRCPNCFLAEKYCICEFLIAMSGELAIDIILLMHRDEILKPTNSGRLIAESFPKNCYAFEWSRLDPSSELLSLINDPARQCAIIYPAKDKREVVNLEIFSASNDLSLKNKMPTTKPTFIMLDGTWRQAARMYNHSRWLSAVPTFPLPDLLCKGEYSVRQANSEDRLSTAEAAVNLLDYCSDHKSANHLRHLFRIFNAHCHATRTCTNVALTSSNDYFMALNTKYES